jgi:hypothetical protein
MAPDPGGQRVQDAVGRVRRFVAARTEHYHRRPVPKGHIRMHPDSIHAEYGRLDMADLTVLCDALSGKNANG